MRRHGVTFVVMAGGRGERLWPFVRAKRPKVCLAPDGRQSLLRATIDRLTPIWPGARWLIVTTGEQGDAVRQALPGRLRRSMLVEPQIKNTAACITLAAVALASRDPQQVMVAVPADHWVSDVAAFRRCVRTGIRAAVDLDTIATIGIKPTHPHTGLGYLCAGARVGRWRGPKVYRLTRFVEKPSRAVAQRLLRRGRTYWNSGAFIGTADKFLECVTEWLPEHTRRLVPLAGQLGTMGITQRTRAAYRALEAVSFDRGVMDHVHGGVVVEGRFGWADLGSWDTWAHLSRGAAHTVHIDSRNVQVASYEPHLVATIGVQDLLIVHTPTATLICPAKDSQKVRDVVRHIERRSRLARYL